MSRDAHPDVTETLRHVQQFTSLLEDQMHRSDSESFTASDEAKTVEVTLNARCWLTDLYIEDGLLRLGAEEVERRINEAVRNAQAIATTAVEAQYEQLTANLMSIASQLQKGLGLA